MRLGISLFQYYPERIGGTGEYIRRLIRYLLPLLTGNDELHLLGTSETISHFDDLEHTGLQRHSWPLTEQQIRRMRAVDLVLPWGTSRWLGREINRLGCDVILCPQQSIFPLGMTAPLVVSIMDLLHERLPRAVSRVQRWIRRRKEARIVRDAAHTISISQATRADWLQLRGGDPERSHVVYLGGRDPAEPGTTNPAAGEGPYLFYPAHPYPHKNHMGLIVAWDSMRDRAPDLKGRLVFTGQIDARMRQLLQYQGDPTVQHLGYCSANELSAIYAGCRAVVLPTLFEGFGMPVVEGLCYGRPVLCSNLPVFHELVGDAVQYFDPHNREELARLLEQTLRAVPPAPSSAAITELRERLTWDRCAHETWAICQHAAGLR